MTQIFLIIVKNCMSKILITGGNGQLGRELHAIVGNDSNYLFTDYKDLDITNPSELEAFLSNQPIHAIVNCAAYTAVDMAEDEVEKAHIVNAVAVKNLIENASKYSARFIHISTDFVFDGEHHLPYCESHSTNPISVYGKTKLDGERHASSYKDSLVIRTSWVYSEFGNNFVKTMIRLGGDRDSLNIISDQVGAPTYARDLAGFIVNYALNSKETGLFHYSNEGVASWYDFSHEIMNHANINCKVFPISTSEYPTKAKRPHYSVLNKSKIKKSFDILIPHWKDSLKECIQKLRENSE